MSEDRDRPAGLSSEEITRYSRHLTLPDVGMEGQLRLRRGSVLVVGAGGLGSPLALYLAAAGVGRIGLVDFDAVDLSNLQRQVLYRTRDVGRPKLELARRRIEELNPEVEVQVHETRLDAENALEILSGYDLVADGTDNFPTRYLINDACVLLGKPNVYGSIFRFEGQVSVFATRGGPCYRCLFRKPPPPGSVPSCAEGGVLGILPGTIGTLQATEVIKLLLGRGSSLIGRLLLFDALEMRFRELKLRRNPDCPACGEKARIDELIEEAAVCDLPAVEERPSGPLPFDLEVGELQERIGRGERPLLIDVRTPLEWEICRLDGARLVPLQELDARMGELDRDAEIVVYCHVGVRSALAVKILLQHGFERARNLAGGIDAWAREIDPSLPRY